MQTTLLATSLMAVLASSKPLEKHYYVNETDTYTSTVTETGWSVEATGGCDDLADWGNWSISADSATTPTITISISATLAPASTTAPTTTSFAASAWSFAPATSSPAVSGGSVSSYAQAILDQHNNHRANHSATALVWDDNMASVAQQIGTSCVYAHNTQAGGGGYGQNIGAGASPVAVSALITNNMYNNEIGFYPTPYGQAQPDMSGFEKWGHFSQIVWKSTTSVGCATVDCSAGGLANTGSVVSPWFTVCNYKPPGNFAGEYGANIAAPQGDPTVTV